MEYLDFELRMGAGSGGVYQVTVVHSPAGEISATTHVPLDDSVFKLQLQMFDGARGSASRALKAGEVQSAAARSLSPTTMGSAPVEQFGRNLFDILLPGELRSCYRASLQRAREQRKGLRIRLRIEASDLAMLPWEYLYDAAEGDYVCLNSETPLVRYMELPRPPEPLTITPPLHILGMIASPADLPQLDVEREKQQLASAIDHLVDAGYVTLDWLKGQTWLDLQTAMRRGPWHIIHFIGHGAFDPVSGEGLLALADENSKLHLLSATQLARLFAGHQSMRLVVLNACEGARASETDLFSSVGAALTRRGIPAVVSMQYEISDQAALEFSRMLYDALKDGLPVDAAVTEARKAISLALNDTLEWGTPVLHMRAPDGRLFAIDLAGAIFPAVPATPKTPQAPAPQPPAVTAQAPAATTTPQVARPQPVEDDARRGLLILLKKVKQFWVEGVLEQSLHCATMIDLGMEMLPGEVDNPWESVVERPGAASQPLPPGQTIRDVFEEQCGSLLILGEPGSGKTTTLLGLARDLTIRAEREPNQPIPVVFNLSAWRDARQMLHDWLIDELSAKYQIPRAISRGWLDENRLLPLLDGLDEVSADRRAACAEAINDFQCEVGLVGVVVCCRLKEYLALPIKLALNAAVRLEPLTDAQVQDTVAVAGPRLAALQATLQHDSTLRIEARSPLMLSLMMVAYQDLSIEDLASAGLATTEARRRHLMDAYIAREFARHARHATGVPPYTELQARAWLAWLARSMQQHGQTVFLIEQLQPSWLSTRRQRWAYTLASRLTEGFLIGLSLMLLLGLIRGLSSRLDVAPIIGILGLIGGLTVGLIDMRQLAGGSRPTGIRKARIFRQVVVYGLATSLSTGLVGGLMTNWWSLALFGGLVFGLIFGLIWGTRANRRSHGDDIQTVETLRWSWAGTVRGCVVGLNVGLSAGLLVGLLVGLGGPDVGLALGLHGGLLFGLSGGLLGVLITGLVFGLIGALIGGLIGSFQPGVLDLKTVPNQGIELTARNAVSVGASIAVFVALLVGLIDALFVGLRGGLIVGLLDGLTVGLFAGLWFGGLDVIQHYTLRAILSFKGYTPWNDARFLDYAANELGFLQKVGGGYIFIHRLLLEHFASMADSAIPSRAAGQAASAGSPFPVTEQ